MKKQLSEKPYVLWFSLSIFSSFVAIYKGVKSEANPLVFSEILAIGFGALIFYSILWFFIKWAYGLVFPGKKMTVRETLIIWLILFLIMSLVR